MFCMPKVASFPVTSGTTSAPFMKRVHSSGQLLSVHPDAFGVQYVPRNPVLVHTYSHCFAWPLQVPFFELAVNAEEYPLGHVKAGGVAGWLLEQVVVQEDVPLVRVPSSCNGTSGDIEPPALTNSVFDGASLLLSVSFMLGHLLPINTM